MLVADFEGTAVLQPHSAAQAVPTPRLRVHNSCMQRDDTHCELVQLKMQGTTHPQQGRMFAELR